MITVPPIKVNNVVASSAHIKKQIYITSNYKSGLGKKSQFFPIFPTLDSF